MNSFLSDRYQYVTYNKENSTCLSVKHGVPQGSVLGPTLFLIYINDLPEYLHFKSVLFADDTTVVGSHANSIFLKEQINSADNEVQKWFESNKLCINSNKTHHIIFSLRNTFEESEPIKLLGVQIDSKLTWESHIQYISKRISSRLYAIRQLKTKVSTGVVLTAYFAYIQSLLSYGVLVWGHSVHTSVLFALQRRCVRVVNGLKYRECCRKSFTTLKIMTFPSLYMYNCLVYVKDSCFTFGYIDHEYHTRFKQLPINDFHRLQKSRTAVKFYCTKLYNKLPAHVRQMNTLQYKTYLKIFLYAMLSTPSRNFLISLFKYVL